MTSLNDHSKTVKRGGIFNKSIKATVNIFIFLFITIDFDSLESFARIKIFHSYNTQYFIASNFFLYFNSVFMYDRNYKT